MGKLIDPGLGEYVDRFSILKLRLRNSEDTSYFEAEIKAIEIHIAEVLGGAHSFFAVTGIIVELASVNAELWRVTDDLARMATGPELMHGGKLATVNQLARIAKDLYHLNRRRAHFIQTLNEIEAGEQLPEEKLNAKETD